jgi:hypothetical protein
MTTINIDRWIAHPVQHILSNPMVFIFANSLIDLNHANVMVHYLSQSTFIYPLGFHSTASQPKKSLLIFKVNEVIDSFNINNMNAYLRNIHDRTTVVAEIYIP